MKKKTLTAVSRILTSVVALSIISASSVISYADETINSVASPTRYAYSIGVDHGFEWPLSNALTGDFTPQVDYACTAYGMISGVSSYKNYTPTVTYMQGNNPDGIRRIASDIVFLNGHGNYDNMAFNHDNNGGVYATGVYIGSDGAPSSSGYTYVGLNSTDMSTCDHISFVGCKTAANGDTNLTNKAVSKGATSALGFTDSIHVQNTDGRGWLDKYNDALANNYTISRSIAYASEFYPNADPGDLAKIYGDSSNTVASSTRSISNEIITNNSNLLSIPASIVVPALDNTVDAEIPDNPFFSEIITKIMKIDSTFTASDYKITVNMFAPQDGNGMIKFKYYIDGDISTNKAYIAYIENNEIIDITCSEVATEMLSSPSNISTSTINPTEEMITAAVSQHKQNNVSVQGIEDSLSYNIVKIDDTYKYDYANNELRYEKTIFYI